MNSKKTADIHPVSACHSGVNRGYQRHTIFEILWFQNGGQSCCQKIDHQKHAVPANSIFLLGKGQIHQLDSEAKGYSISLSSEFFQHADNSKLRILFNPFINEPILPDEETSAQLESILTLALAEIHSTNYQPVINSYLEAFIYKLSLLRPQIKLTQDRFHRLENLFQLVEKYYLTERKVSFYADRVDLTPKRLNEILKNKVDMTVTQLIHKVIISEAKKMIAKGDKSIKEVSYELNFSEQAYFSRFFKKQTGMSPEKFAKMIQDA